MSHTNVETNFPKFMKDVLVDIHEDKISVIQEVDGPGKDVVIELSVYQAEIVAQWLREAAATINAD